MYHTLRPFQAAFDQPITALCFDPVSDVLWSANQQGTVSAFHDHSLQRGAAFPASTVLGAAVNKIVASDDVVRASSIVRGGGLGGWNKGGSNKWYYLPGPVGISTFDSTASPTTTLVAVTSSELLLLNTAINPTPTISRQSSTPSLITQLTCTSTLAIAGCADGFLRTYDPRTALLRSTASAPAHPGGVSGLATGGQYVYSIGWGIRSGRPHPDPFAKIYDIRSGLKSLASLPFSATGGPSFIGVHPNRSSTVFVVAGESGFVSVVDAHAGGDAGSTIPVMTSSFITSFAVSPTGEYLALGDGEGTVHLLTTDPPEQEHRTPFNGFEGQAYPYPDIPEPLPSISWTDHTPLNSIGLPYYTTPLLSSLIPDPPLRTITNGPPMKTPIQILNTMKQVDGIGYAALPAELRGRRNVVTGTKQSHKNAFGSGRFRSVKHAEAEPETPINDVDPASVPRIYRKVEIEYSKFGVEDFDFEFYNKTSQSGLETHIINSYTNALIQVLHYTLPIRAVAKSHLTDPCMRENCLLCELGFVCRMLEDAKGVNCQTSNFCKVMGNNGQAMAMGLVDYGGESHASGTMDYSSMIQLFNRFLLEQLAKESSPFPVIVMAGSDEAAEPITQLFGLRSNTVVQCTTCGDLKQNETVTRVIDVVYTPKKTPTTLQDLLETSLARQTTYKATCSSCRTLSVFASQRQIQSEEDMPPILAVNASVLSEEQRSWWSKDGFLQEDTVEVGGVAYRLRAVVAQIRSKDHAPHLIAFVKIPDSELSAEPTSPWYMFNDFAVRNVDREEALDFSGSWKTPSVLYFERDQSEVLLDLSTLPMALDRSILSQDISLSPNRDPEQIKHQSLASAEMLIRGTMVAIDAEFVQMQQEEVEYRADGSKKVLRPSRLSLARVSVLRGEGPDQGVPCIDDHIHTSETIVNYLTEFSGVKFGDLDPHLSKHTLVPLKVAYKKLRVLVDLGCVFIGHGLLKDFRIINIFVPRNQVIDTVDLYFLRERQRRLSLRFLTWYVLKQDIQQETHDSIEDARSALLLYNTYEQYEETGVVEEKLVEIYKAGKQHNWRPPSDTTTSPTPGTATPNPGGSVTPRPFSAFQPATFSGQQGDHDQASPFGSNRRPATPTRSPLPPSFFQTSPQRQQDIQSATTWRRQRDV